MRLCACTGACVRVSVCVCLCVSHRGGVTWREEESLRDSRERRREGEKEREADGVKFLLVIGVINSSKNSKYLNDFVEDCPFLCL